MIRLHGGKLRKLCNEVYERDGGLCVHCGKYVQEGTKPHHVNFKSKCGGDTADNLVILCYECHYAVHHGGGEMRRAVMESCRRRLGDLYENYDQDG